MSVGQGVRGQDSRGDTQQAWGLRSVLDDRVPWTLLMHGHLTHLLAAGGAAGMLSAAFAILASRARRQDATRPINAVSHIVHGGRPPATKGRKGINTVLGSALHFGASLFWAAVQRMLFRRSLRSPSRLLASSAGTAALAYVVDYYVVDERFRPGFEIHLPKRALFGVYASFALGLTLGGIAHGWVSEE